jgi:hypothetical protein
MPAVPMSVHDAGISDLLPSGSSSSNSIAPCRRIPPNTRSDRPCNGWRTRVTFTAAGRSLRPVVSRGFVRFRGSRSHGQGGGGPRRCSVGGAVCQAVAVRAAGTAGRDLATARPGHPARVRDHAPNAMGNFCFDVTLSYRRLERQRRVRSG